MTLGNELGTGLGAFAQQFIGTQNTLKQQQLDQQQKDAEYNLKLRQQAATEGYNQSQLAQGQQTLDQQAARDAAALTKNGGDKRSTDFQNILAPTYNGELQSLGDAIKNYGPGAGANFNPAVYDHAMTRMKQLKKLMGAVSLTTASGEGYDEARAALLNFVGAQDEAGNVHPAPSTTTPGGQSAPTPAAQPVPQIDMRFAPVAHGDAVANGDTGQQGAPNPAPAAPPQPGYSFAPSGNPMGVQAVPTNPSQPAAAPSPAPVTSDLSSYPTIQDVPPSVLMNADNAALVAKFGNGADQYAQIARSTYKAAQAAQQQQILEGQVKYWQTVTSKILDDPKHPATPAQLRAAAVVNAYAGRANLTPEQSKEFGEAIQQVAPAAMNSVSWGDILATKDPATILAAYPMYQKLAPEVIQGFDPTPYQTQMTAALDATAASTAKDQSQTGVNNANALETTTLLPGKVQAQTDTSLSTQATTAQTLQTTELQRVLNGETKLGDVKDPLTLQSLADNPAGLDALGITRAAVIQRLGEVQVGINQDISQGAANLGKTQADTVAVTTGTGKTVAETLGAKTDTGVKLLAQLSSLPSNLSYYQIGLQYPGLVSQLKTAFGMNDTGATNLIRQAQATYAQGFRGKELENALATSKIATEGAQRGLITANTADVLSTTVARNAELQPRLNLLNEQIHNAQLQGQDTASLIQERNTLLPVKVQEGLATAANSRASATETTTLLPVKVAEGWGNVANLQSQVHARNVQANLDLAAQRGKLDLTQATIDHLTAQTLYQRAKNPNDPLYNPAIAAAKPGDPNAATYKQINALAGQARLAGDQVSKIQAQINALKPTSDGLGGYEGAPTDDAGAKAWLADRNRKINDLTAKRDQAMRVANNRRALADKLLLDITPAIPTPGTSNTGGTPDPAAFKTLGSSLGLPTARRATPYGQMYTINGRPQPHNGEDIFAPPGTPIKAPFTGYVTVQHDKETGNELILTDANGQKMLLGHLQGYTPGLPEAIAKAGGRLLVKAGQPVGLVGQTGTAAQANIPNNSHTHVMAYDASGKVVNPLSIQFKGVQAPATATATTKAPAGIPVKVTTGTTLPAGPARPAAFKPNPGLESGLITGVKNGDPDATNSFGNQMLKAGYSQDQVLAIIKRAQGQK